MERASCRVMAGEYAVGGGCGVHHLCPSSRALDDDCCDVLQVGMASHLDLGPEVGDMETGRSSWGLWGRGNWKVGQGEEYRTLVL